MKTKISEKDIQLQIKQGLELLGFKVFRINNQGTFNQKTGGYYFHGTAGVSDLFCVHPVKKLMLWVECKREGGKLRTTQQDFLELIDGFFNVKGLKAEGLDDIIKKI